MGREETKGLRRRHFPLVHTNSRNLWACDNTFKHFCYFHRNIWCWCSNVMLLQQSCPSAHSSWQALGYQEEEEGKKRVRKKNPALLTDCVWHLSWQEYSERRKEKRNERWEGKRKMEEWQRVIDVWNCMCEKNNSAFSGFVASLVFSWWGGQRGVSCYCHVV